MDELAFLAFTLGIKTVNIFIRKLKIPNGNTVVFKRELEEIESFVKDKKEIDVVIFDDELNPSQVHNLERVLPCKVTDRTLLILDIFAMRARTKQAKTQVELAQYQYFLPRLTKMWSHLSSLNKKG